MRYIRRAIEPLLLRALQSFPAVLITGARQTGKSTLLTHLLKNHQYISFDDPLIRQAAVRDPSLFLQDHPPPLILDEVQYVPEIFSYLKLYIDRNRHAYGQYVLTGSQIFQLMKDVSESLAGRIAIFRLYPFCLSEIESVPWMDQILRGFYPELFINPHLIPSQSF